MATQCSLSSLKLRVQFCLLVCCTYSSSLTVNKEKNLIDQRASLRVDTRETQQVHYSVSELKYSRWKKRLLLEHGINQILIRQLKLYSVMCCFIVTCMLLLIVKAALIFVCGFFFS